MMIRILKVALAAVIAAAGATIAVAAQEPAAEQQPVLSPEAQVLLTALQGDIAEVGDAATITELRARMLETLVSGRQEATVERAVLERLLDEIEAGAARAAIVALLAQMPATVEGYQSVDDFALGGAEGGEAPVPPPPSSAAGGGSDY